MLFDNLQLSQKVINQLRVVFNKYNINNNKLSKITIESFYEEHKGIQLINERLFLDILDVVKNIEDMYKLLDNISESIWDKYYPQGDKKENFFIKEYENFFIEELLTSTDNFKVTDYNKLKIKEMDFDNIQIEIDKITGEYFYKDIPKKYTKIIDNIFVLKKIIKFFNRLNKSILFDKSVSLFKYYIYEKDIQRFKNKYMLKTQNFDIIGNKISSGTNDKLDKICNLTYEYLKEECSVNDELYNFFDDIYLDTHFNDLYMKNKRNNFMEYLIKSNADLYYLSSDKKKKGFFIISDIYTTYLNLIGIYNSIESFSHLIKKFVSKTKKIPYELCNDKLFGLYQFNNMFPKKGKDTFFVMVYCFYLKANYEDVRTLMSLLLKKRNSSKSFARYDHTIEYGEVEVSLKLILEKFKIFIDSK